MNYSYQRQIVLETLREQRQHLTARELYQQARKNCPHLSLGTVYRNLNTLVEIGQAGRVAVPGEADRYDWEAHTHHHIYCRVCQQGKNLSLPANALDDVLGSCKDVKVENYSFIATGLCGDCMGAQETE